MNNGDLGARGRGRGWQLDNQPRELRRPRIITDEPAVEAPKSTLSAEAKEWYPPNYNPQAYADPAPYRPQRFSVQDRLRQAQDNPYNFDDMSYSLEAGDNVDLRENIANLITVMCEITFDPGKFDVLCGPLVDSFVSTLHDATYTRPLIEAIVNQSIAEPNFRYNGARLCSMYDSVAPPEESTFRACLLERCSIEEEKIINGSESLDDNIRGFAMFLAEIYTQLEDSQGRRIRSLGESLCKVFLHLLDSENEVNIKSVCQLLKLSGIALDADCPSGMSCVFDRLSRYSSMLCVRSVLALRAARWGLAEPDTGRRDDAPNGPVMPALEPVESYLADGHALSAEEKAFLESNLSDKGNHDDTNDDGDEDGWDMDAEMQEGFLEFLKMSNQIKR